MKKQLLVVLPFEQLEPLPAPGRNERLLDAAVAAIEEAKQLFSGLSVFEDTMSRGTLRGWWRQNGEMYEDRSFLMVADLDDSGERTLPDSVLLLKAKLEKAYASRRVSQKSFYIAVQHCREAITRY